MDRPTQWTPEQRAAKKRKIDKEGTKVAARLGAKGVYMAVYFDAGDGKHGHLIDGGNMPIETRQLLTGLLSMMDKLELSGGEDIQIQ